MCKGGARREVSEIRGSAPCPLRYPASCRPQASIAAVDLLAASVIVSCRPPAARKQEPRRRAKRGNGDVRSATKPTLCAPGCCQQRGGGASAPCAAQEWFQRQRGAFGTLEGRPPASGSWRGWRHGRARRRQAAWRWRLALALALAAPLPVQSRPAAVRYALGVRREGELPFHTPEPPLAWRTQGSFGHGRPSAIGGWVAAAWRW